MRAVTRTLSEATGGCPQSGSASERCYDHDARPGQRMESPRSPMSTVATGGRSKQRDRVVRAILHLAGRVRQGRIRVNPAQSRDRANAVELLRGLCVKGELGLSWDIPTRRRRGERGTRRKSKRDCGRKQYGLYITLSSRDRPVLMARSGGSSGGRVCLAWSRHPHTILAACCTAAATRSGIHTCAI
jgi:hypothetical protein